ncbi:type I-F CRISPR-associated endonuclease Cas1f [Marinicella gelatinilytica]|uniref:type I-F CRISPR-associated endonuclease Cas1f n=1 Tax=Marinicella gelatinilytica TaxID=2996017 RepID=UPI002260D273|nr:type I-F CRISPR-associated endonuclease Cas1f [Marinicella gelatinilytica]MCX7544238.1 type I-F CRISPR-associated endonuclease Cas1f [Marinicella gelatinilytica]
MEQLSNLKHILHSKRANLYYIEHCRVMQKDGRVLYLTEAKKENQYWNIPIANTTVILLGTGTSITQAAMRMLASAGVLVGFCGGGGTPLLMANEIEWLMPQSEYRPTEYMQGWMQFWFDDNKRLSAAKKFQLSRLLYLNNVWRKDRDINMEGLDGNSDSIQALLKTTEQEILNAQKVSKLLAIEADLTKRLYKTVANSIDYGAFRRDREATDKANAFLNHGNYLAYGLAATTLWVLGIPHGFAVMHGKTRRGALVFDIADLIKDAIILPWAFISAKENAKEQEFRQQCLQAFTDQKALDFMFDQVKEVALNQHKSEDVLP